MRYETLLIKEWKFQSWNWLTNQWRGSSVAHVFDLSTHVANGNKNGDQ